MIMNSSIVIKFLLILCFILYSNSSMIKSFMAKASSSSSFVRYLESNSWDLSIGNIRILLDPVLIGALDFGIPLLYKGERVSIDGQKELETLSKLADYVLITQGFDDHAHTPTLKKLSKLCPKMTYICPPSAKGILENCGIGSSNIMSIVPGETLSLKKEDTTIDITGMSTSSLLLLSLS